jgi:hypothetical protein
LNRLDSDSGGFLKKVSSHCFRSELFVFPVFLDPSARPLTVPACRTGALLKASQDRRDRLANLADDRPLLSRQQL